MIVIACIYLTDEGECRLKNKACDGCKDLPNFVDWEAEEGDPE